MSHLDRKSTFPFFSFHSIFYDSFPRVWSIIKANTRVSINIFNRKKKRFFHIILLNLVKSQNTTKRKNLSGEFRIAARFFTNEHYRNQDNGSENSFPHTSLRKVVNDSDCYGGITTKSRNV